MPLPKTLAAGEIPCPSRQDDRIFEMLANIFDADDLAGARFQDNHTLA
jgi:hypothetical protein